jgi:hypothetical protein
MSKLLFSLVLLLPYIFFCPNLLANELDANGKYIVQSDRISCGPIAMVNAMKFMDYKLDEMAWLSYLKKRITGSKGASLVGIETGIRLITNKTNITYTRKNIYRIEEIPRQYPIIFVGTYIDKTGIERGHVFVICDDDIAKQRLAVINLFQGSSAVWVENSHLKKRYFDRNNQKQLFLLRVKK